MTREIKFIFQNKTTVSISVDVRELSKTIKDYIEDFKEEEELVFDTIPNKIQPYALEIVKKWLEHYKDNEIIPIEKPLTKPINDYLSEFDNNLISKWDEKTLSDVMNTAQYLQIPKLIDLCAAWVGYSLMSSKISDIRNKLGFYGFNNS